MNRRSTRVCVLVKAYPQPSEQYEETVCVAGIEIGTGRFLRLYPIPYRRLPPDRRFGRYDVIEVELWRDTSDPRPESHKVNPDSIRITQHGTQTTARSHIELWSRSITPGIEQLENACGPTKVTLGIIPVDTGSMKLAWEPVAKDGDDDKPLTAWMARQGQLLNDSALPPLAVDYSFFLTFKSCGAQRRKRLMDWEAQATYASYRRKYGDGALDKMREAYEQDIAQANPHLFLGTMKKLPFAQFVLIGVLRSGIAPETLARQGPLL